MKGVIGTPYRQVAAGKNDVAKELADFVAAHHMKQGFRVAVGSRKALMDMLRAAGVGEATTRLVIGSTSTGMRKLPGVRRKSGKQFIQVRADLQYNSGNTDRILREIARHKPECVLIESREASADDDVQWARVIAGQTQAPTILAIDVGAAGFSVGGGWQAPLLGLSQAGPGEGGIRLFEPSPSAAQHARPRQPRFVNTIIHGGDAAVEPGEVLRNGSEYTLGIGVGRKHVHSLLGGDAMFPDEMLRDVDRWLDVHLWPRGLAGAEPATARLFLPVRGSAYTCSATTELDHSWCSQDSHHPFAWFPFTTPPEPGSFGLDVHIHAGAALVHAQHVSLAAGTGPGATATVTFRLQDDLSALPDLTERAVSTVVGAQTLTVNGLNQQAFTFEINDAQWSAAAANARRVLTNIHLVRDKHAAQGWRPKHDLEQGIPMKDFLEHLKLLAIRGHRLFAALFPGQNRRVLPTMLRLQAALAEPVIQIARTTRRPFAVPWPIVYTLPVIGAKPDFWTCPAASDYGPGGRGSLPAPARCPREDEHTRREADEFSVLCPFGFWGLANIIEVPEPPDGRGVDDLVSAESLPPAVLAATGEGLNNEGRDAHLATLRSQAPGFPTAEQVLTAAAKLPGALSDSTLDVFYVLCHAGRDPVDETDHAPDTTLVFIDQEVVFSDIGNWATHWPHDHWSGRRPLVVLNACHTVEATQSTLGSFVTAFVSTAGASGVVGTESLVDQQTASAAMEFFLAEFLSGQTAGEAIRTMRWKLLRRGSVMGLAYTPYCSATLRMRTPAAA